MISGAVPQALAERAMVFGAERRGASRQEGLMATSFNGGESGTWDEEGAVGEFLVAVAFGVPGPKIGTYKEEPDVGPFEVETVTRNAGDTRRTSLIIRPSDLNRGCGGRPYLLVTLHDGAFTVPGWLLGDEGPTLGTPWSLGGSECWLVDRSLLHPFDEVFWVWLAQWRLAQ